jgi:hypothetical protein
MESKHKLNDVVSIDFGVGGRLIGCIICAIKTTSDTVKYDILVPVEQTSGIGTKPETAEYILTHYTCTKIQNVDSALIGG